MRIDPTVVYPLLSLFEVSVNPSSKNLLKPECETGVHNINKVLSL